MKDEIEWMEEWMEYRSVGEGDNIYIRRVLTALPISRRLDRTIGLYKFQICNFITFYDAFL